MIEFLIDWWQFTVVAAIIGVAGIVNLIDKDTHTGMDFKTIDMPHMKPLSIPTKGKGFWGAIYTWLMVTRTWEIVADFQFSIDGTNYIIPKGFVFDGASVPKFLHTWLSPMGVLLTGGLIHDYMYKYTVLLKSSKNRVSDELSQSDADKMFRDINIEVNGFRAINYLAYWALVVGGFFAWKGHRKNNKNWKDSV